MTLNQLSHRLVLYKFMVQLAEPTNKLISCIIQNSMHHE